MKALYALALVAAVSACAHNAGTAQADPSSDAAAQFSTTIWPAIADYSTDIGQGGQAESAIDNGLDPALSVADKGGVKAAVRSLSHRNEYDEQTQTTHFRTDLKLQNVNVGSVGGASASLAVCYSYVHNWYTDFSDVHHASATSEFTADLHKTDKWYLQSITNDHVVPDCRSSKA